MNELYPTISTERELLFMEHAAATVEDVASGIGYAATGAATVLIEHFSGVEHREDRSINAGLLIPIPELVPIPQEINPFEVPNMDAMMRHYLLEPSTL